MKTIKIRFLLWCISWCNLFDSVLDILTLTLYSAHFNWGMNMWNKLLTKIEYISYGDKNE